MSADRPTILAVIYRSPYLFTALGQDGHIFELRRHRVLEAADSFVRMRWMIQHEAVNYQVTEVIVEPKRKTKASLPAWSRPSRSVTEVAVESLDLPYRTMSLKEAKSIIDGSTKLSERKFIPRLLATYPELRRFVRVLPTGNIAAQERWKTWMLTAAAMALAAGRSPSKE